MSRIRVLALALVLRVLWIVAVPVEPTSDSIGYNVYARNLAKGFGYCFEPGVPAVKYPVGPSFAYSAAYRVLGQHFFAATLVNLTVALLGIWFAMLLAEIWFGRRTALLAGLLLAVWPEQIEFVTVISSELLFNCFLLMWMVAWSSRARWLDRAWARGMLMGVAGAATCYMRPIALLLPPVLLTIDLLRPPRLERPVWTAVVSCAVMLALIAPWTLRNWRDFHAFVPISANGGLNLYEGNHPGAIGDADFPPDAAEQMTEVAADRYVGDLGWAYIRAHPAVFVGRLLPKLYRLYARENFGAYWNRPAILERYGQFGERAVRLVSDAFWFAAFAMSLSGLNLLRRRSSLKNVLTHPCFAICAYISSIYMATHAVDRFHFACVPFLAMLAALTLGTLLARRWPAFVGDDVTLEAVRVKQ